MDLPLHSRSSRTARLLATCRRRFIRRFLTGIWLVTLAGSAIWFFSARGDQVVQARSLVDRVDPNWVAVALGTKLAILITVAATYQVLLRRLGRAISCHALIGIQLRRSAVGTFTPFGGPGSAVTFVRGVARHGVRAPEALLVLSVRSVAGNIASGIFIFAVLLINWDQPLARSVVLALSGAFLTLSAASAVCWRGRALIARGFAASCTGPTRRLPRRLRDPLHETYRLLRSGGFRPRDLALPIALALAVRVGGFSLLIASLRGAGEHPPVRVVAFAFVVGMLSAAAAPLFHGIGVVEAGIAVALQRHGVDTETAVSAALLSRTIEIWLPAVAGLLLQLVPARSGAAPSQGRPHSASSAAPSRRLGPGTRLVPAVRPIVARAESDGFETSPGRRPLDRWRPE